MIFMKHVFFLIFLLSSSYSWAMEKDDSLPELHWKKVMPTREDLHDYWMLHQDFLKEPKDHIKFLALKDLNNFDEFYRQTLQSQQVVSEEALHLNLNPLSGVYLFYLKDKKTEPIGYIKLASKLEEGCIQETVAFKEETPKGAGQKALSIMRNWVDQHHGKKLRFLIERTEDAEVSIHEFGDSLFFHIIGATEFTNISSLISHVRMGMEPLVHIEELKETGETVKGVYLVYPTLNDGQYSKYWLESYNDHILPQKELMAKLKEILNTLSSKNIDKRMLGLRSLNEFVKSLPSSPEEK